MAVQAGMQPSAFISYSHKDEKWLKSLNEMLVPLVRGGLNIWSDQRIRPGDDWRQAIEDELAKATVAILLVSPAFLASEFIRNNELPPLLAAARQNGLRVLWIPVSTCLHEKTPIATYEPVHPPHKPLDSLSSTADINSALKAIALKIQIAIESHPARWKSVSAESQPAPREIVSAPSAPLEALAAGQTIRWRTRWRLWQELLADGVELPMAWIPAALSGAQGEFLLASQPITLRQWQVVAGWSSEGDLLPPDPSEHHAPDQPVTGMSHRQAREFCKRLASHTGRYYELPSHDQWEQACRAGSTTAYSWGEHWSESLAADTANPWGLRQMHGGLWEWSREGGLCGGSWNDPVGRRQCGSRAEASESLPPSTVGLRVCCLPFGTPPEQLEASRSHWRPPLSRSACEEMLARPLSEEAFADLMRGLRRFRIRSARQLRLFFSLLADRLGAGADDPRQPLRLDEAAAGDAFAKALADPAITVGNPGWSASFPYSSAAYLWQWHGLRQRAEEVSEPEAFWAFLELGGGQRQQAFEAAARRALARLGGSR
jgi:hypothetical protein